MRQQFIENKNYIFFDSISDITKYLKTAPLIHEKGVIPSTEDPKEINDSFFGKISYAKALNMLEFGDEKLAKKIKKVKNNNINNIKTIINRQQRITSPYGFAPHIPNAILGRPNNMIAIKKHDVPSNNKIIDLIIQADVNASADAQTYTETASTILNIVDTLESRGYRLNLYYTIVVYFNDTQTTACWVIKLKSSAELFNKYKCAFPLGHIAMFRRIGFRLIETLESGAAKHHIKHGYGEACDSIEAKDTIIENLRILNGTQPKNLKMLDIKKCMNYTEDEIIKDILKQ